MKVFIDQSGKIEDTAKPTVIAYSNGNSKAIKVSASVKRKLQEYFRRRGQIRLFIYRTFSSLVFLLIKPHLIYITDVVIDIEYPGHEKLIKDILLEHIRREELPEPSISFQKIGSTPKVHYAAYDVFTRTKHPDYRVNFETLISLAIKKDRGLDRLKKA